MGVLSCADYYEYLGIDASPNWETGTGSLSFFYFRTSCQTLEFRLYRGKPPLYPSGQLMGVSNPVTFAGGPLELYQPRAAFGVPAHEVMYFSWTVSAEATPTPGIVQVRFTILHVVCVCKPGG